MIDSKLYFIFGCIPTRLFFVYLAKFGSQVQKQCLAYICLLIGIGFWTIYIKGWRQTGIEVNNRKIWWNHLRPIHGTLYLLFALTTIQGYKFSWIFLLIDILIGTVVFLKKEIL